MSNAAVTLTEFLLARYAEDEAVAERLRFKNPGDPWGWQPHAHRLETSVSPSGRVALTPARVLAECEAKRRIVELFGWAESTGTARRVGWYPAALAVRHLALPYADHPDYRDEWKP